MQMLPALRATPPQDLETEMNAWLQQNPNIKIVEIKQSASGGSLRSLGFGARRVAVAEVHNLLHNSQ